MDNRLDIKEKKYLLRIARNAIYSAANKLLLEQIKLESLTPRLREDGASFVTLTLQGRLRGCIGALEAYQPLALDVQEHAISAAFEDYRFSPIQPAEIDLILIEISVLTKPKLLQYQNPVDLLEKLNPGIDGVLIRDGVRRATFLPQVWAQLPDKKEFLSHLCRKMGVADDYWMKKKMEVSIYQVDEFQEER